MDVGRGAMRGILDAGISRVIIDSLLVIAGAASFAGYGYAVLAGNFDKIIGFNDWDQWYESQWVAYKTIFSYHELPFWDPYRCGGMPLLGHPESHFISPWFALTAAFGPIAGLKMELPIYMAICWAGAFVLGRALGMRPLAALAPALLFASSSWLYERAVIGQISILSFAYLPLILAATWCAREPRNLHCATLGGLLLGLVFLEGGPYPLLFIVTVLAAMTAATIVSEGSYRPAVVLMIVVVIAVGFSAVKFFPAWIFAHQNPRPAPETQYNTIEILRRALFSPDQKPLQGLDNGYGFWESGAYVGPFVIPAILALITPRRCAVWIFCGAVLLMLSQGDSGWLWPLVHRLPMYSSLRIPSRFLIPFTLIVGVLAGFGLDWIAGRYGRPGFAIAAGVLALCSYHTVRVGPSLLSEVINDQKSPGPSAAIFRQTWVGPDGNQMLLAALENDGVVGCTGYQPVLIRSVASDRPGYQGEQYLIGPGNLLLTNWSPDAFSYRVAVPTETTLVIDQNYDSGWRNVGGELDTLAPRDGLLSVGVQAGRSEIQLRYFPASIAIGGVISVLTILGAILLYRRPR